MSMGLIYWILMLLWLVFGLFTYGGYIGIHYQWGGSILLFVLLLLSGWKIFGPPVRNG